MSSLQASKRHNVHVRIFATICCLCLFSANQLDAQQTWNGHATTYTAVPPQTDAAPQTPSFQPQQQQQPFANPPQAFVQQIPVQRPAAITQPAVGGQDAPFDDSNEEGSSDDKQEGSDDEGSDNEQGTFGGGLENAKNTFVQAFFHNHRPSQIALATKYLLPIFTIVLVMLVANWLGSYLRDRVSSFVSRRVDATLGRFSGTIAKLAVVMTALMVVLASWGVEMTSLAALIAALGFAVGMALQGTLGNFASGIALLVFRPFNVGDYIVVDDCEGTVQAIELFTTSIDTLDNRRIIIPNENLFGHRMENWSHNKTRRADVLVGVAYSADMKQTRRVLLDAMASVQGAIPTPSPEVYLNELNASSVDWSCRVWCRPAEYLAVKERVAEAAKDALDRNGISIPFPQLDLHVVTPNLQQQRNAA